MKKISGLLLLTVAMSSTAWADCSYPRSVGSLPLGLSATREEMLAGKKKVDEYQEKINTYLICLKKEHEDELAAQGAGLSEDKKKQMVSKYTKQNDAAVDDMQSVADRFNEQLRAFRSKNAK